MSGEVRFRYGAVFVLTLTLLVFAVIAPNGDWSRAVWCALLWLALLTVVATSHARAMVRRPVAGVLLALAALTVGGEAAGALSDPALFAISGALSAAIPLALVRGSRDAARAALPRDGDRGARGQSGGEGARFAGGIGGVGGGD
jgi:hypothetical protein